MRKFGFIMLAFVILGFVVVMVFPDALAPIGPVLCHPGERFVTSQTVYHPEPGETDTVNNYYCVNSAGDQRDISGQLLPPVAIGYAVLLFISIMLIGGRGRKTTSNAGSLAAATTSPVSSWTANDEAAKQTANGQATVRFGGKEVPLSELKGGTYQHTATTEDKHTLAETLRQLNEAHNQNLISDDEYQHLRQEALDKLV